MNNTWSFVDGDIVLSSDDPEQIQLANEWIAGLTNAIKIQTLQEVENGRTNISDQPELPEVPC